MLAGWKPAWNSKPHGHRKATTLVAGLRMTGVVAPMVLDGPINGGWFEVCVRQILVPDPGYGDVVIIHNLSSHKRASVRGPIKAAANRLLFLLPYSLDLTPIKKAFSRLEAMLRKAGERTVSGLPSLIGRLVDLFQKHRNAPTTSAPPAMTKPNGNRSKHDT